MARSRSRSPQRRERRRSRSRERERRRERRRSRSKSPAGHRRRRSRSFSPPPPRRRSRSFSPPPPRRRSRSKSLERHEIGSAAASMAMMVDRPEIDPSRLAGKTDNEVEMMKLMGFCGFDSTKGKHVQGNDTYVANLQRKRRYRQYMNRRGGFNRPLDFIA